MNDDLRTFTIKVANFQVPVTLGFYYTGWVLALAKPANANSSNPLEHGAIVTTLNVLGAEQSFPPPDPETGRPAFYMMTDSENRGMLPQLEAQGILKKIKPKDRRKGTLVEVLLKDTEIAHTCMKCVKETAPILQETPFELPGEPRLRRCSKCSIVRYCDAECLQADLTSHRTSCHIWHDRPHEAARLMENQRRADLSIYLAAQGFQTIAGTGGERRQDGRLLNGCLVAFIPILLAICLVWLGSALWV
ncbi:uncharacterized protein SCHCODRAFT_02680256 [Schizophyllum commune H4-8]|uniref:MYND-type domain-containing protein n=1 Tax=Schizophyllum commune (strain H4-8 / FGSC 9210) TaxID=578458 RepID=D8QEN4_SCHCM|nr:uncharacterized protein SCHCODRAFT_02680256 [Schizophyllum commune H4-8]KAI5888211.1 hypothetical protein SCHCODRAFT_02680256 [Schizophyllum commune H4-8]